MNTQYQIHLFSFVYTSLLAFLVSPVQLQLIEFNFDIQLLLRVPSTYRMKVHVICKQRDNVGGEQSFVFSAMTAPLIKSINPLREKK